MRAPGVSFRCALPAAEHTHRARAVDIHLDAQQPALDATVPYRVRAIGPQPEFLTELRRTGEHRRAPALEMLPQNCAELAMHLARTGVILQAHAVRRIGAQESRASGRPLRQWRGFGERGAVETKPRLDPGTRSVLAGTAHRGRVTILAAHGDGGGGTGLRPIGRLPQQSRPQRRVVSTPAEEAKIITRQSRRAVGGNQRRLDAKGSRAAQRIEKLGVLLRQLRPLRRISTPAATFSLSGASPAAAR